MRASDVLRLGAANLREATTRTVLTTLGVAIGVAALVGMVAIGQGLQDNFRSRLEEGGFLRSIAVLPFSPEDDDPVKASRKLDDKILDEFRQISGVKRVDRDIRLPLALRASASGSASGICVGLPLDAGEETTFDKMVAGGYFSAERAPEIIVTQSIARALGYSDPKAAIGKTLNASLGGPFYDRAIRATAPLGLFARKVDVKTTVRIVGIVERERVGFGSMGASIFLPYGLALRIQDDLIARIPMASRLGTSYSATVRLHSARDLERVEKVVTERGYRTLSLTSMISRMKMIFLLVDALLGFIGSIGLVVACLGIANTMITSVLERTREIGVMKAIGAEDGDILRVFLAESAAFGLVGGLLGILLARLLAFGVNAGANWYFHRQGADPQVLFAFPPWLLAGALGLSIVVCVGAALLPARRAAGLEPSRALRHD